MSTTALATPDEKKLEIGLVSLRDRANAIVVRDEGTYREACQITLDARAYIKAVGFELDPGISKAKETYDHLKNQKDKFVAPAKAIAETASKKGEDWRAEEKRQAEAEARRLQEQARIEAERKAADERRAAEVQAEADRKKRQAEIDALKASGEIKAREAEKLRKQAEADALAAKEAAAAQEKLTAAAVAEVKVVPSIPKVAGIKGRTNWKFKVVDAAKLPRHYLMPNEVAIGADVRNIKDKAAAEAAIPGIEVYSEESI